MAVPKEKIYTEEDYYSDKSLPERCELINGAVVNLVSPNNLHQKLLGEIFFSIKSYIKNNNGKCEIFPAPADVKLFEGVIVQPDIYVTCHPEGLDGQKHVGAPDWIIEIISPFNAIHDFFTKANLYHDAGVREYWIVDPKKSIVHVYIWDGEMNEINSYSFDEEIPVWIYSDSAEKLSIKISEYF